MDGMRVETGSKLFDSFILFSIDNFTSFYYSIAFIVDVIPILNLTCKYVCMEVKIIKIHPVLVRKRPFVFTVNQFFSLTYF